MNYKVHSVFSLSVPYQFSQSFVFSASLLAQQSIFSSRWLVGWFHTYTYIKKNVAAAACYWWSKHTLRGKKFNEIFFAFFFARVKRMRFGWVKAKKNEFNPFLWTARYCREEVREAVLNKFELMLM